ncbi:MAG: heparan-alpha-glucosaminide N-acetyltransferase domain-containing protein [Vicinamibacterales bacterium]
MTHSDTPAAQNAASAARSGTAVPVRSGRILFIDLARAIAVLLMVQGHTIDALLHADFRGSLHYNLWLYMRGLTSCTFLFLSGAAFSLTALRHWDDQGHFSPRSFKRVRRLLFFLSLGYFIRFPMGRFVHLQYATAERWQSFFVVDVLQNVAVTLLGLQFLIGLSKTPRRFAVFCGLLATAIVTATPVVHDVTWTDRVPLFFASYFSYATGSNFPLFPWAGFTLLGAVFGVTVAPWSTREHLRQVARGLLFAGAILAVGAGVMGELGWFEYGSHDWWRSSPLSFVQRFGSVLLLLSAVAAAGQYVTRLTPPLQGLAEESLLVYAVHVALLYGSHWTRGLGPTLGPQPPSVVLFWAVAMIAAMTLLALVWNNIERLHPRLAVACRITTVVALVYRFL